MVSMINIYDCLRCGHEWPSRKERLPKVCPKCKSPYWNKPKWKGVKSETMSYFLTVHLPIPVNKDHNEFDNCIWVNQATPHRVNDIRQEDCVAVYEVATSHTPGKVMIGNTPEDAYLPRGGMVSLFRVTRDFIPDQPIPYEGNIYLGKFQGDYISQNFVPLDDLNKAWKRAFEKSFNPRLRGGIKRLSIEEYQLIARLMGVEP